jgi:hypothetical protein
MLFKGKIPNVTQTDSEAERQVYSGLIFQGLQTGSLIFKQLNWSGTSKDYRALV